MSRVPVERPGWDSHAVVVDGRYIERVPRREPVRQGLERECRVLPVIAPLLPLPVPVPVEVPADATGPWRVRHQLLPGAAAVVGDLDRGHGRQVGGFLRALHDLPLADLGLRIGPDALFPATIARMRAEVLPLLDPDQQTAGADLLNRATAAPATVLAHRDLGPEHLLVTDGSISGIIDWTDAGLDDPAMDLAWVVHGTPARFRDGLLGAYDPSADELRRSLDWHRLGPWHEVLWGSDEGGETHVRSGLDAIRHRLAT
jgi:aminoglycoside phosphotransferase (APT) family kinase protein